jgi:hypothetical protein
LPRFDAFTTPMRVGRGRRGSRAGETMAFPDADWLIAVLNPCID